MVPKIADILAKTYVSVDDEKVSDGIRFFMVDIFWDELEKVGAEEVLRVFYLSQVFNLILPFLALRKASFHFPQAVLLAALQDSKVSCPV
jgi:hypothetical protein